MAFPTGVVVPTTNLSTAAGDPSLARAELFTGITAVNDIISSANQASGIAMLSANQTTNYHHSYQCYGT